MASFLNCMHRGIHVGDERDSLMLRYLYNRAYIKQRTQREGDYRCVMGSLRFSGELIDVV